MKGNNIMGSSYRLHICKVCGKQFRGSYNKVYCSDECKYKVKANKKLIVAFYDEHCEDGMSYCEMAKAFGCNATTFEQACLKAGRKKPLTKFQVEVKLLREKGYLVPEIADLLNKDATRVNSAAKAIGLPQSEEEKKRNRLFGAKKSAESNKITTEKLNNIINEKLEGKFTYISGYENSESKVKIRCNKCGEVIERSMVSIRHGLKNVRCDSCFRKEIFNKKNKRKEQEKKEKERKNIIYKRNIDLKRKAKQIEFKICPVCNKLFYENKKFCSTRCREISKCREKEKYRYIIPLSSLAKRDGDICHICGCAVDWNDFEVVDGVTVYGNMYPSRDHVVPKSKGGEDSWDNIKLAHRICNSLKGAKIYA